MKTLALALLISLVAFASANEKTAKAHACKKAIKAVFALFSNLIENANNKEISQIINEGPIIPTLEAVVQNCGDIKDVSQFSYPSDDINDRAQCIEDITNFVPVVVKTIRDLKNHRVRDFIWDLGFVFNSVTDIMNHCFNHYTTASNILDFKNFRDTSECTQDIEALIPQVDKIVYDASNNSSFSELIKDIIAVWPVFDQSVSNCNNFTEVIEYLIESGNYTNCTRDILKLVLLSNQTLNDIHNGNLENIIEDIKQLAIGYQNTTQACHGNNAVQLDFEGREQCLINVLAIQSELLFAYSNYRSRQVDEGLVNLANSIQMVKNLQYSCAACQKVCHLKKSCYFRKCGLKVFCTCRE
eukprot:TRINITY_DN9116_c0_g1_i3.p1 TRINITY_DN9116_c0_g1~~TRINITY_DN9116_c0_g1_i3.p1  ORF type:complete len:356 (-),score=41.90 TRINITY_DN9116_c0_g1_i3:85-1152(-)